jgi:CheY-like chemotaxis protein
MIITELYFSEMNGLNLIRSIREKEREFNLREIPIVAMTGKKTKQNWFKDY